jgi:hypothetical protein
MRIFLKGCLFEGMKRFKYFVFLSLVISALGQSSWAQDLNWPLTLEGDNFQITTTPQDHFSPVIASNGYLYFVVWYGEGDSGFDIYGTRITKNGEILDGGGIRISTAPNDQIFPAVASDGENFLVVWQDMRSGKRWDIYGARVTSDGQVIDTNGFPIAVGKSTSDQVSPDLTFDGGNYLVVWQGKASPKIWNVYFSVVSISRDGNVTVTGQTAVSPVPKNQASPAVAFNGEDYLIVWQDFRSGKFWDIYGAMVAPAVDAAGYMLDGGVFPINFSRWDKWKPAISWDGSLFSVVWTASQNSGWYLEGKRVDPRGYPDIYDFPLEKNTTNKISPAIIWDGEQTILVWEEEPEGESKIFGASTLSQQGTFVMSVEEPISSPGAKDPCLPGVSGIRDESLVIWQGTGDDGYWHIYGQRLKKVLEFPSVGPFSL